MPRGRHAGLYALFALVLTAQVMAWMSVRDVKARWLNVPPPPGERGAAAFALGDTQLAYRTIGLMLQNLGDTGGRSTALKDYDYDRLTRWFDLADRMDPRSNFVPYLAAFYFGGVEDPEKLLPLTDYLYKVGSRPHNPADGQKWRWLAHAIYLARYKLNDMDKAYRWSLELAAMDSPDMPPWTKQMPAFIQNARGDRQAAYDILVEILKSGKGKLPAYEINTMKDFICKRVLDDAKAKTDPLCRDE